MPIPKLPAALVAVLGTLATILAAVQDSLPSPWAEVATAVLAILTVLGVPATVRAVRRHGEASAHNAITRYTTGTGR
jgi:membrane protein implicated in regulation of membrane protease activity